MICRTRLRVGSPFRRRSAGAESELARAIESGDVAVVGPAPEEDRPPKSYERAGEHLDRTGFAGSDPNWTGDVALLGGALERSERAVVTDDDPLREACKALSIPVSGSIGVPIRAIERGESSADEATEALLAMDEVGARLSARLLRRAERSIADAAGEE